MTPTWYARGGKWVRRGHADIDPNPPPPPPPPAGYDWTASPYGSVYDSRMATWRTAGGYTPDVAHAGVPAGTTFRQTISGSSGYLTISSAATPKGTGTASATTGAITLPNHGLANGHPVYFSALTGGSGLATGVANWCVVSEATTNTFKLQRPIAFTKDDVVAGIFVPVTITADYSAVAVVAGVWYDRVDFACHIKLASAATGLVLCTRCRHRGPGTAIDPATSSAAQGLVFNLSSAWVLSADEAFTPDDPVNKLNAVYGKNFRMWRPYWSHTIDGIGSQGNVEVFGVCAEKAAWIYPDTVDGHSDGTHNDTLAQIHGNDHHVIRGAYVVGKPDPAASSTTDPAGHAIPLYTNSDVQIIKAGGLAVPTGVDIQYSQFAGGGYPINIAGKQSYPALGTIANNQVHLRDSLRGRYTNISGICAPAPNAVAGVVVHCDIFNNIDETGTAFDPYVDPAADLQPMP